MENLQTLHPSSLQEAFSLIDSKYEIYVLSSLRYFPLFSDKDRLTGLTRAHRKNRTSWSHNGRTNGYCSNTRTMLVCKDFKGFIIQKGNRNCFATVGLSLATCKRGLRWDWVFCEL